MKLCAPDIKCSGRRRRGFSLVEVVVAMGLFAVSLVAVLSGIPAIIMRAQFGQEQAQATQIMLEKMEQLRMTPWMTLTNMGTLQFQVSDAETTSDPVPESDPVLDGDTSEILLVSESNTPTSNKSSTSQSLDSSYSTLDATASTAPIDSDAYQLINTDPGGTTETNTPPPPRTTDPGTVYTGTVVIENNPVEEAYRGSLTRVKIKVQWTSANNQINETELVSYVSQHGVQSADNL